MNPTEVHTFSLQEAPTGMNINTATGLITWTPTNEQSQGTHDIVITTTDNEGAKTEQTYTITVANTNDEPKITSEPITEATEETPYNYQTTTEDDDYNTMNPTEAHTFSLQEAPTGMNINPTTGLITWTPTNEQSQGEHDITVKVTDTE